MKRQKRQKYKKKVLKQTRGQGAQRAPTPTTGARTRGP